MKSQRAPSPRTKKNKPSTRSRAKAVDAAVLRDRGAPVERTFVDARHTEDALAELLGESTVRSITSGQDEPVEESAQSNATYEELHVVEEA